jgi:CO dehydrogenase/acetyl-CoA synthase beta subunit
MELFDRQFDEIRDYLSRAREDNKVTETLHSRRIEWPSGNDRNLVLAQDTEVELGNPKDASTSFILWGNDSHKILDARISLIGPDLPESRGKQLPFGKVVLIGGNHFTAENAYDRYREMESIRFHIDLQGYMIRAVSQYQREWSRVSREAVNMGFSLNILGGALIDKLREKDYVKAVEVIFVTSGREDVIKLKGIAEQVGRITSAMNKMVEEMSFDCDTCEYEDVCGEVAALRSMRDVMERRIHPGNG